MTDRIERAADLFVEARTSGTRLAAWPSDLSLANAAEAAQIQRAVVRKLGVEIGGWKVALFADGNGLAAPILKPDISESPVIHQIGTAATIGIEAEVAFWMAHDLPGGRTYSRAKVIAAIAGTSAAIELVDSRFLDMDAVPRLAFLADNLANRALVYGAPSADWPKLDLTRLDVRVLLDGQAVVNRQGGHSLDDPLLPLVWLANHLANTGRPLRAGDIVTTGAFTGLHQIAKSAEVSFSGMDSVRVNLA